MPVPLPPAGDLTALIVTLDGHPVGGLLLCLLVLAIAVGLWAYRAPTKRAPPKAPRIRTPIIRTDNAETP